jgi:hypothetical protein
MIAGIQLNDQELTAIIIVGIICWTLLVRTLWVK